MKINNQKREAKLFIDGKRVKNPKRVKAGKKSVITRKRCEKKDERLVKMTLIAMLVGSVILGYDYFVAPHLEYYQVSAIVDVPEVEVTYDLVSTIAREYHVNPILMWELVLCENRELNPELQSRLTYNFSDPERGIYKGHRELSFGVSQIHLPDHPHISPEQAKDPIFALNWMAKELQKDNSWKWKNCYEQVNS